MNTNGRGYSLRAGGAAPDARGVMRRLYRGDALEELTELAERDPAAWERVCEELFESQIATLFFSFLKRRGLTGILPKAMREEFRRKYEAALAANILIQEQFFRLEAAAREAGVEITPMKGLDLHEVVYDDPGARVMADIDVFVSEDERVKAIELLKSNGYECAQDVIMLRAEDFHSGFQFRGDVSRQTLVELHWNVMDPVSVKRNMISPRESRSLSRLFAENRVECARGGRQGSALAAEHSLLFMLLHIYSHNFIGDKWRWDLPLFLDKRGGEVDWEAFFSAVSRYRLEKIVHSVFLFAERALGFPFIPEEARRRFAGLPGRQRWVCEQIAACDRSNLRLLLNLLLHTSVPRMLMTVTRYFFPTRRRLEMTACERVRWRDYPRVYMKVRIHKILRALKGIEKLGAL